MSQPTSMTRQNILGLVLLASALSLGGCLFTADEVPEDKENNTTPIIILPEEDMSAGDMGVDDMAAPEDLAPPACDSDGDCGQGEICEASACVMASCDDDDDCPGDEVCSEGRCAAPTGCSGDDACGPMEACVAGACTDLLVDNMNCGVKGFACPSATRCVGGMCACDGLQAQNNYEVLATANSDGLAHYPSSELITYFGEDRIACAEEGTSVEACDPSQLELDQNYPPNAPHYAFVYVADKKTLKFKLLDERGIPTTGNAEIRGDATRYEDEIRDYRIFPGELGQSIVFIWWHSKNDASNTTDFVQLYTLSAGANGVITPTLLTDNLGKPQRLIETNKLLDFGFTFTSTVRDGKQYEVFAIPYIYNKSENDLDPQGVFKINTFVSLKGNSGQAERSQLLMLNQGRGLEIGPARQLVTGFDTQAYFHDDKLVMSATLIEDNPASPPFNTFKLVYRHRVWTSDFSSDVAEVMMAPVPHPDGPWDLYNSFEPNVIKLYERLGANDHSMLPPAPIVFAEGPPNSWSAISWTRDLDGGTRTAVLDIVSTGANKRVSRLGGLEKVENFYTYDQMLSANFLAPDQLTMVWMSASQPPNNPPTPESTPYFARIIDAGGVPALSVPTKLHREPFEAQRISAQFGTRSTGVVTHGNKEARFFAIVDGSPVCKFPK